MPHDPSSKTDSIVWVNGERLPMGQLDVHIRKEGSLGVGRYVEGRFFSPFQGEDYLQHFETVDEENQSGWDVIRVDILDRSTGEYHCEFQGMVTGLGNSPGIEREWEFRARGPGLLLDRISASKSFADTSSGAVLEYIEGELERKFPLDITVTADDERIYFDNNVFINLTEDIINALPFVGGHEIPGGSKAFLANRDTLADVIEWLRDRVQMRCWFQPTENGAIFVGTQKPSLTTHKAHYLQGDLRVVQNDALAELRPINTLTLKSKVTDSLGPNGLFEIKEIKTGSEYNVAKVREPTLYKRAGGTEYIAAPDTLSDATTREGLVNDAKSLLKQEIDESTGGDLQSLLRALIKPYDVVEAQPTCDSSPATDTDPVQYEVSRVHHEVKPSGISQTILNVGLHTALEDIEVVAESTEPV